MYLKTRKGSRLLSKSSSELRLPPFLLAGPSRHRSQRYLGPTMESEPDTVARISPFSSRIDVEDVESSDGDDNEVVHSPLRSNGADSSGGYSPLKGAECNAERPGTSEPSTVNEDAASQARSRAATSGNASQRIHITSTIVDAVTTVIPESYVVTAMVRVYRMLL